MSSHREPWYFTPAQLKAQPSIQDGLEYNAVQTKKHNAFKFVERMREQLNFPQLIMNTAMVLYHRFFYYQSMKQFNWLEMSWCCLFTALKIEEKVMKMESLLKWSHHTTNLLQRVKDSQLDVNGQEYFEKKERLQFNERILLQTIGFDCEIVKTGFIVTKITPILLSKELIVRGQHKKLARLAFEWSHASYGGEFCLLYEPELMACALIYGAAKELNHEIKHPPGQKWWELCTSEATGALVTEAKLNDIMQEFHDYCIMYKEPRRAWVVPEACTVKYIGKENDAELRMKVGVEFSRPFGNCGGEGFAHWKCRPKHGLLIDSDRVFSRPADGIKNPNFTVAPLGSLQIGSRVVVKPPIPDGMMIPKDPRKYRVESSEEDKRKERDFEERHRPVLEKQQEIALAAPKIKDEVQTKSRLNNVVSASLLRDKSPDPVSRQPTQDLPDADDLFGQLEPTTTTNQDEETTEVTTDLRISMKRPRTD